jgi:hypothetical protein
MHRSSPKVAINCCTTLPHRNTSEHRRAPPFLASLHLAARWSMWPCRAAALWAREPSSVLLLARWLSPSHRRPCHRGDRNMHCAPGACPGGVLTPCTSWASPVIMGRVDQAGWPLCSRASAIVGPGRAGYFAAPAGPQGRDSTHGTTGSLNSLFHF